MPSGSRYSRGILGCITARNTLNNCENERDVISSLDRRYETKARSSSESDSGAGAAFLYRPHRGSLNDSLTEVVEVNDFPQLVRHMRREVERWYPIDQLPTLENTKLEHYGYDERIGWDTYLVTVNGQAWGYTNGVPMKEDEALAQVRRTISGTVLTFVDPLDPRGREDSFLVGDRNADIIIRALNSAGWSWVRREGA